MHPTVPPPPSPVTYDPGPFSRALTRALEKAEMTFWFAVHDAAPADAARALGLHRVRAGEGCAFLAPGADVLALNKVLGLGLDAPATEADLDAVVRAYRSAGARRFFIQLSPTAAPPDLPDALTRRGFRLHNHWVKLVRDLHGPLPAAPTALAVEEIGRTHAARFGELVAPAFDWPAPMAAVLAATVGRPGWRHYLALDGAEPAAAAGLYVRDGIAYFGPAVTLDAHRRRGAQSALIARRLREARAMGASLAVVDTAAPTEAHPVPSLRNLRRLGFGVAYHRPNYLFTC